VFFAALILPHLWIIPEAGRISTSQRIVFFSILPWMALAWFAAGFAWPILRSSTSSLAHNACITCAAILAASEFLRVDSGFYAVTPSMVVCLAIPFAWMTIGSTPLRRHAKSWLVPLMALEALWIVPTILARITGWNPLSLFGDAMGADRGAFVTTVGHANYLGSCLMLASFLALHWASDPKQRAIAVAMLTTNIFTIALIGARGAALGLVFGLAVAAALNYYREKWQRPQQRRFILSFLPAAPAAVALLLLLVPMLSTRQQMGTGHLGERLFARDPLTTRFHSFVAGREIGLRNVLSGVDRESVDAAMWNATWTAMDQQNGSLVGDAYLVEQVDGVSASHTHNELLQVFAAQGFPGVLLAIAVVSVALAAAVDKNRPWLVGGIVAFLCDGSFAFPSYVVPSGMMAGWLIASSFDSDGQGTYLNHRLASRILSFLTVSVIFAAWQSQPSAADWKSVRTPDQHPGPKVDQLTAQHSPVVLPEYARLILAQSVAQDPTRAAGVAKRLSTATGQPLDYTWYGNVLLARGAAAASQQNLVDALAAYRRASLTDPHRLDASVGWLTAALALWDDPHRQLSDDKLIEALDHLRRVAPRHPALAVGEGMMAERMGETMAALRWYRQAVEWPERDVEAATLTPAERSQRALRQAWRSRGQRRADGILRALIASK